MIKLNWNQFINNNSYYTIQYYINIDICIIDSNYQSNIQLSNLINFIIIIYYYYNKT